MSSALLPHLAARARRVQVSAAGRYTPKPAVRLSQRRLRISYVLPVGQRLLSTPPRHTCGRSTCQNRQLVLSSAGNDAAAAASEEEEDPRKILRVGPGTTFRGLLAARREAKMKVSYSYESSLLVPSVAIASPNRVTCPCRCCSWCRYDNTHRLLRKRVRLGRQRLNEPFAALSRVQRTSSRLNLKSNPTTRR